MGSARSSGRLSRGRAFSRAPLLALRGLAGLPRLDRLPRIARLLLALAVLRACITSSASWRSPVTRASAPNSRPCSISKKSPKASGGWRRGDGEETRWIERSCGWWASLLSPRSPSSGRRARGAMAWRIRAKRRRLRGRVPRRPSPRIPEGQSLMDPGSYLAQTSPAITLTTTSTW